MRTLIALVGLFALLTPLVAQEKSGLVVHEWGTFTSVAGADGVALEWRPLAGPSDLPGFVYTFGGDRGLRHGKKCKDCSHFDCACGDTCSPDAKGECGRCKTCFIATVRMETPVIYFYSKEEVTAEVKVGFPKGKVTEWYPQAREVGAGIEWGGVRVLPGVKETYPIEKGESHYYPARETDASPLRVCGDAGFQLEKFLFYRGAGSFDLPITASLSDGRVTFELKVAARVPFILFENRGGRCEYSVHALGGDKAALATPRPADSKEDATWSSLDHEGAVLKLLLAEGLYEKEARAMIKTWRDSWFEEGLRAMYIVPRSVTDAVLPLTVNPKPAQLVRVLVGRLEILTPEFEKSVLAEVARLGDPSLEVRDAATKALARLGRFAEPVLKRTLASTKDAELKARIQTLLGG